MHLVRPLIVGAALLLVACGCNAGMRTGGDRPSRTELPPAAEPQNAPPEREVPVGTVIPVGHAPEGVVVDALTRTVVVATRDPDELVLISADSGDIIDRVALPGTVRHLQLADPGGPVLVPVETADALLRLDLPQGTLRPPVHTGTAPHDATEAVNHTVFVANEHGATVVALRGDQIVKVFTGSVQPAGSAAAGAAVGVLDVRRNDLTVYDAERLTVVGSAPAGAGPTHLVADRHGRMIAADTRGDAVRVFTPLPTPREVASIAQPGGPYGIAYDSVRDRLWVASSGNNEVIGYDMGASTPKRVLRFATVQNPYTVGVDSKTGRVFVAGVTGGVVQVIDVP
jgi:DNA-binding beta-propeller fold protein YncE